MTMDVVVAMVGTNAYMLDKVLERTRGVTQSSCLNLIESSSPQH